MKKLLRNLLVLGLLFVSCHPIRISGQKVTLREAIKSMLLNLNQTEFIEGQLQAKIDFGQQLDSLTVEIESPIQYQAQPHQALLLDLAIDGEIEGSSQSDLLGNFGLLFEEDVLYYNWDFTQPENNSLDWRVIPLNEYGLRRPRVNIEELPAIIDKGLESELFALYEQQMTLDAVNDGYRLTMDLLQSEEEIEQAMSILQSNLSDNSWIQGDTIFYFAQLLAMFDLEVELNWHLSQDFFPNQVEIIAQANSSETAYQFESTKLNFQMTLDLTAMESSPLILPQTLASQTANKDFEQTYDMLKDFMEAYHDEALEGQMPLNQAEAILGPAINTNSDLYINYTLPLSDFEYKMTIYPSTTNEDDEATVWSFTAILNQPIKPEDLVVTSSEDRLARMRPMLDNDSYLPDFEQVDDNFENYRIHFYPENANYINTETGEGVSYQWDNKEIQAYINQPADFAFSQGEKTNLTVSEIDQYFSQNNPTIQELIDTYGDHWVGMINSKTRKIAFSWRFLVNNVTASLSVDLDDEFNVIDYKATGFDE